ncbi:MAG: ATP-binding cassette domain-containing protein [Deltaproteobacteria bacterium]|nr:ATP-binding cassette domain-containing protein [Deltaproteobacteria bacterium]
MTVLLDVRGVEKSFRTTRAVDGVSFGIEEGEIFGLLGPNGAGKSTLIRMMLDIYRPDEGSVLVFGHPMEREDLDRIGYLPEERGLYRKRRVIQVLRYLGQLKGLTAADATASADRWLLRLSMEHYRDSKVESLSKGNQQKIQLIGTLLGDPPLLVWDEPFSGLDPVNANQVRDLLIELRDAGTTVVLSTHLMAQAEAVCDRVGLIHGGRMVLCGPIGEVRQQFGADQAVIITDAPLAEGDDWPELAKVLDDVPEDGARRFTVCVQGSPEALARRIIEAGYELTEFHRHRPTLEDVFLQAVAG